MTGVEVVSKETIDKIRSRNSGTQASYSTRQVHTKAETLPVSSI